MKFKDIIKNKWGWTGAILALLLLSFFSSIAPSSCINGSDSITIYGRNIPSGYHNCEIITWHPLNIISYIILLPQTLITKSICGTDSYCGLASAIGLTIPITLIWGFILGLILQKIYRRIK